MMGDKKKLLFVITQGVVGGAQKYVFDLAKHFSQTGDYDVSVAIGGRPDVDLFKKLAGEKIKTHCLKFLGREVSVGDDTLSFFEMLKLFREEKPDIIHLNSSKVGLMGALAAFFSKLLTKNYKPKTVFTAHGWIFKEDLPRQTRRVAIWLARFAALFQDRIICVSQDDFGKAIKYKIAPPRKLYTIYNAVEEEKFLSKEKARAEVGKIIGREISEDAFVTTNLGRLYANKGLNYLIEAVGGLKVRLPEVALVIFGDGPEKDNLKSQISNLKLDDSIFLAGDITDVSKYLPAFDAMVLSSTKEGFPYSILEAGLAGVPMIVTNVGGVGEIIKNSETGILIEAKNSKAIANAISKLWADVELTKKLSKNLKKSVLENFDFKTMTQKTEWVYKV